MLSAHWCSLLLTTRNYTRDINVNLFTLRGDALGTGVGGVSLLNIVSCTTLLALCQGGRACYNSASRVVRSYEVYTMAGWQGLWTDLAGNPSGYSLLVDKNPIRNRIKRVMNRKGMLAFSEIFDTLINDAVGATAARTHKEIGHAASTPVAVGALGGARTIDTITDVNRATVAADATELTEMVFNVKTRPSTYPRDLSGNGGPAF
jgi:hypothetical protein